MYESNLLLGKALDYSVACAGNGWRSRYPQADSPCSGYAPTGCDCHMERKSCCVLRFRFLWIDSVSINHAGGPFICAMNVLAEDIMLTMQFL